MTVNIFDIQRFSLHDGPGIRTVVFFKGCNLRCLWCHNPESQRSAPELMLYKDKCVGCGACAAYCAKAFTAVCARCGACASLCAHGARERSGRTEEVNDVIARALRDAPFYRTSGGGVTLSGGEPLLQPDAAAAILSACMAQDVPTAVETAGNVPWEAFESVLPSVNLFLFDIKGIDEALHRRNTGVSNRLILENARKLCKTGAQVRFRMPYVPGFNAHQAPAVAAFAKECGVPLELMAYHNIGAGKYDALERPYPAADAVPPTQAEMREIAASLGAVYEPTGV